MCDRSVSSSVDTHDMLEGALWPLGMEAPKGCYSWSRPYLSMTTTLIDYLSRLGPARSDIAVA
jgi:hypothetical protein